ncbi:hypothetical protein D5018_13220 [Parashewanella curva]|uniref:Uncharacterized protein n=1 Tax=Parashewanella curva TaxID=2338552 RepID=A0A3L8PV79_9GAMM|nr:hypothetical protein [Parashewanella curva]RLV59236.1 hypothetical protein D5018_13220 [Parashewanella curva]
MVTKTKELIAQSPFSSTPKALLEAILTYPFPKGEPEQVSQNRIKAITHKVFTENPNMSESGALKWLDEQNKKFSQQLKRQRTQKR